MLPVLGAVPDGMMVLFSGSADDSDSISERDMHVVLVSKLAASAAVRLHLLHEPYKRIQKECKCNIMQMCLEYSMLTTI